MWIRDYVRKSPISVQLTAWFLLIALLPLAAVSYVLSQNFAQALAHTVTNDLRAIAGRQVRQLEAYFRERERSVIILAQVPQVVSAMEKLDRLFKQRQPDAATHAAIVEDVRPFLQHYQELFGYADLFLISPDGTVGFSMRGGPGWIGQQAVRDSQHAELAKAFDRAKTLLETGLSNFAYDPQTRELTAFLAAPVLQEKKLIGVVALQIRSQEVYAMVNDLTGLGESGETLLAARVGSEVVFVTPPRHGAHEKIVHTADSVMVQAVLGAKGSGATTDYRGQEVLAVWQYLASLGNGLVMKIDIAEAFAPIARLRLLALMIGLLTLGLVVLAAVFVARSFSRPIVRLTAMTEAIARGDLTQRIDIPLHNEIGLLAASFNDMTRRLDESLQRVQDITAAQERIESELRIARQIQMGPLPKTLAASAERPFSLFAFLEPARDVGGDFYDYFYTDDRHLCLVIGDVSDKGVPASLCMAVSKTLIRATTTLIRDLSGAAIPPDEVLGRVNVELERENEHRMFVTVFLTIVDTETSALAYSNAGHNPPLIFSAGGSVRTLDDLAAAPLGVRKRARYGRSVEHLLAGETLFLYTDGISEAEGPDGSQFTEDCLKQCLERSANASPEAVTRRVLEAVDQFRNGSPQSDDMTVMAFRYNGATVATCGAAGRGDMAVSESPS